MTDIDQNEALSGQTRPVDEVDGKGCSAVQRDTDGDGINDALVISYKLREVSAGRPVVVRLFDLAGRRGEHQQEERRGGEQEQSASLDAPQGALGPSGGGGGGAREVGGEAAGFGKAPPDP